MASAREGLQGGASDGQTIAPPRPALPPLPHPPPDDAIDVLDASAAIGTGDRREAAPPKVDADFFQAFDDDLDERDMRGGPQQQQQ